MPETEKASGRKRVVLGFEPPKSIGGQVLFVLGIIVMSALQPILQPYNDAAANYIVRTISTVVVNYYGRLFLEVAFLGAVYGLYRLKKSKQRLYGGLECGFAVLTAWLVFERLSAIISLNEVVALIGAGYLLVRGLTNYSEGRDKSLVITKGLDAAVSPG